MSERIDETWHRLREWTSGQAPSERLSAQILLDQGYKELDPSHPLGGPDGGKDALAVRNGKVWLMAVYFPKGQQTFTAIEKKFTADLAGCAANDAEAFAFVTNQEITLSERKHLRDAAAPIPVDLYHLERVTALLEQPAMTTVRDQYLATGEELRAVAESITKAAARIEAVQTGGDTFCYWMLYHFDLERSIAQDFVLIREGGYPLYDVRLRIVDMNTGKDVYKENWGELNSPADYRHVKWLLPHDVYFRVFFHARNGTWHQDLQLRRSEAANCWLAVTRVSNQTGDAVLLTHVDNEYVDEFGEPEWRD